MPTFSSAKQLVLPIVGALALAACGSASPSVAHLSSSANSQQSPSSSGAASSSGGAGLRTSSAVGSGGPSATMVLGGGGAGKALKFARCMRAHGVPNFPDPSASGALSITPSSGINPQSVQVQAAFDACGKLLALGGHAPTPAQQAQALAQALRFSQCMRKHGVANFPDPQGGGGGRVSLKLNAKSGIDPRSPMFEAAQKVCQPNLPALPGSGPETAP